METLGGKSPEGWNNAREGWWLRVTIGLFGLQVTEIQMEMAEVKRENNFIRLIRPGCASFRHIWDSK